MNLLTQFTEFVSQHSLFQKNDRLLIAVSGGVDSVVLCELCFQAGYDFEIAHCNFQLRGNDSELDESFVKSLSERYKVELHSIRFDTETYAAAEKVNIQIAARELRYQWFNELSVTNKINHILTAHHADDNIETVVMNFFKGTGIKGLQGMIIKDGGIGGKIVRPLLFARKEAIALFAKTNNLTWREDVSNASSKYTRNYFRNELLPAVEKVFPQVQQNLLENTERFKDATLLYEMSLNQLIKKLVIKKGQEVYLPVLKLLKTPALKTVLFEIIKGYHFSPGQLTDAVNLLNADSGKFVQSSSHRLLKNRNWLIVSPLVSENNETYLIEKDDQELFFDNKKITIKKMVAPFEIPSDAAVAMIDERQVSYPLILRKWKQGDYFYPLGMIKKKKLSRFFIDNKLSLAEKEKVWVIESNKKIIWIVGQRIDNRAKITEATNSAFCFTLISSQ